MSVASRLPSLILLAAVLVVAALLVAGFGVAVGLGIIAGCLLGLANFVAFLALRPHSGAGHTMWLSRTGPASEPDLEFMQRHGRDSMRVAAVDEGALRRVIPAGSGVEAGGALVELVVVEIREDGGIATLVAHTRPPVGYAGHFVDADVSDDAGTAYFASGGGSGGSSPTASRYEIRFAPAPPTDARALTIRVASFDDPFAGDGVGLGGPWEFRVAL